MFACLITQSTVKSRLMSMFYHDPGAFDSDVQRVFKGAIVGCPKQNWVVSWVTKLEKHFAVSLCISLCPCWCRKEEENLMKTTCRCLYVCHFLWEKASEGRATEHINVHLRQEFHLVSVSTVPPPVRINVYRGNLLLRCFVLLVRLLCVGCTPTSAARRCKSKR